MKRKIRFLITVGSYFPEKGYDQDAFLPILPVGGEFKCLEFEFETDKPENSFDNAIKELRKRMEGDSFHYWYWWWIE